LTQLKEKELHQKAYPDGVEYFFASFVKKSENDIQETQMY